MRELKPTKGGDEPGVLILTPIDGDGDGGADDGGAELFRLPVTDELRELVAAALGEAGEPGRAGEGADESAGASAESDAAGDAEGESAAPDRGAGAGPSESAPEEPRVVLRPREIQDRVRAGASVAELVELTGMPARRIEPFAHPVLAERSRIAELGKRSHPRRSEGAAPLSLEAVLATAFAARGQDFGAAEWDAWRDISGQWVIGVTWSSGHSTTTAEYAFHAEGNVTSTVARNTVAAELVDPDFAKPRRSLAPVGEDGEPRPRPLHPVGGADAAPEAAGGPHGPAAEGGPGGDADAHGEPDEDEFLRHPDDDGAPRRRRKTVMPSWEDVLLGVRPTDRK